MTLLYFLALFLDGITGLFDAHITDIGIRKGVAVEGNELMTWLFRTVQPKFWQISVFNFLQMGVLSAAGIVGLFINEMPLIVLSAAMLAADSAHHIKAFFEWRKLGA